MKILETGEDRLVVRGVGRSSPRFGAAVALASVMLALLGARDAGLTCTRSQGGGECAWYRGGLVSGDRGVVPVAKVDAVTPERDNTDQVIGLVVTVTGQDDIHLNVPFTDPALLLRRAEAFEAFLRDPAVDRTELHLDARAPVIVFGLLGVLVGLLMALVRRSRCLVVIDRRVGRVTVRSRLLGSPTDHVVYLPLEDVESVTVAPSGAARWQVVLGLAGGATRDLLPETTPDRATAETIAAFLA